MSKKSKGYTLTYYEEYKKNAVVYHIPETNFYNAEKEALQKLSEAKRIDFKKKDKITLIKNKSGDHYHAAWFKHSPIMDKKNNFYLEKFIHKPLKKNNTNKNTKIDIFGVELYLFIILCSLVGVSLTTFTKKIPPDFVPYIDGSFLLLLLIFSLVKDFLYEKLHNNFKNDTIMGIHILLFETFLAFGSFTTIFSFFYKQYPKLTDIPELTVGYIAVLLLTGVGIQWKINKNKRQLKYRDRFHNRLE
ncbi:hypothetical protein [Cytobacillus horneckiae]|uniref:hypothetical protein n=1 Tax=Cytobacillus horneckiae TaxID=549687 RepID=UPI003D1E0576